MLPRPRRGGLHTQAQCSGLWCESSSGVPGLPVFPTQTILMIPESPLTWMDIIMEAWILGKVSMGITFVLLLIGLRGLSRPFKASQCLVYSLLGLLPLTSAMFGADYLPMVFRDPNGHLAPETLERYVGSGEAALPLMLGCLCSCVLMFTASLLWMRCRDEDG